MGSPDHLAWLPKVVGRLLALLVILPLARKKTNRKSWGSQGPRHLAPPAWLGVNTARVPHSSHHHRKRKTNKKNGAPCVFTITMCRVFQGGSCGPPNLPHIPPANGSSRMPLSTGGGNVASQLATLTARHVLTTDGGGYEDPTSLHLALSGQMRQYVDCQFRVPKVPLRLDTHPTW